MKKKDWIIAAAAGAGVAAVAYRLLAKDIPDGAAAVQPFDISRFLGKWNEVARLPNRIEKNLEQLTEEYTRDNKGGFNVITRACNIKSNEWKQASGKLKFAGSPDIGMLKVSYLRPFYLPYNVLDIDLDYRYALVSASSLDYLWLLSKETTIPDDIKTQFLDKAATIGFEVSKLEWM